MASWISARILRFGGSCAALLVPLPALADEAFLCGPSEVVYVPVDQLEFKKKTDPCIAAYFGLTVDPAAADQARSQEPRSKGADKTNPTRSAVTAFKTIDAPQKATRDYDGLSRAAMLMPPEAAPGTDFRNVKIINAAPEGSRWFKHLR